MLEQRMRYQKGDGVLHSGRGIRYGCIVPDIAQIKGWALDRVWGTGYRMGATYRTGYQMQRWGTRQGLPALHTAPFSCLETPSLPSLPCSHLVPHPIWPSGYSLSWLLLPSGPIPHPLCSLLLSGPNPWLHIWSNSHLSFSIPFWPHPQPTPTGSCSHLAPLVPPLV